MSFIAERIVFSAKVLDTGDVHDGEISRNASLGIGDEPRPSVTRLFVDGREVSVVGRLDGESIAAIGDNREWHERPRLKLFF
jgi:hypothetical protein